ncbi:hypothetical protein FACS1894196_4920 [Clostridia bacterium]|nr:hypothetical protein FACS1894196_4920 [Clostridia bacterium]
MNLKLRGRSIGTFFCLHCLSRWVDCAPAELRQMIVFWGENGCELFEHTYVDE